MCPILHQTNTTHTHTLHTHYFVDWPLTDPWAGLSFWTLSLKSDSEIHSSWLSSSLSEGMTLTMFLFTHKTFLSLFPASISIAKTLTTLKSCQKDCDYEFNAHERHHKVVITVKLQFNFVLQNVTYQGSSLSKSLEWDHKRLGEEP